MIASKLILTGYRNGVLSLGIQDNKVQELSYTKETANAKIGDIYVAKVLNVVPAIKAAFIDYQAGKKGFLPLSEKYRPVLLNRTYDGRILAGDEIIVQMEKEAIREKEPVFTLNLSLSGKYCVVSNANTAKSVSNKLDKQEKELLRQQIPEECEYGIVVRTNAKELLEKNDFTALHAECDSFISQMTRLLTEGIHRTCYSRLYQAPAAYLTQLRDNTAMNYEQIVTDDEKLYDELMSFVESYMPEQKGLVTLYQDDSLLLSKLYSVETKLQELLQPKVWLNSGAYLVIEQTEAMYVIDVNSGKNSKKASDSYMFSINMEAAAEVMRQIRLRNLSGIIIVDFINMDDAGMQEKLLNELHRLAHLDPIKTTIVDMTPLGLIEITRKKTKSSLKAQLEV